MRRYLHKDTVWVGLLCLFACLGCQQQRVSDSEVTTPVKCTNRILGYSVEQRPIAAVTLQGQATQGGEKEFVLLVCGIHGNEAAATPTFWSLINYLKRNPSYLENRSVMIVPKMNPDGIEKNQRYNAHGVDLNRNFAAQNRKNSKRYGRDALSEPEAVILRDLIVDRKPDRIVMMHQPLRCIDYNGPAEELANHMANFCDVPVKKLNSCPGSLGSWAGDDLQIPIITFELHRDANKVNSAVIWDRYHKAILAAITYPQDP